MTRLRISKGRLLDPSSKLDAKGDLCIENGRILAAGKSPPGFKPDRDIDATGRIVTPGLVDLAARFREPGAEHKATIAGEATAAAAGGVTTVCCPPDTTPVIDTPAVVELIYRRAAAAGTIRILPLGAMTHGLQGEQLAAMQALLGAGCAGIANAREPIRNSEVLRRAMEYATSFGLTVHLQAEDHFLRNNGVVHEGAVSTRLGLPPSPAAAETVAVSRALLLAEQTGARLHLCRISAGRSVELIAAAKAAGLAVTADVAICNLILDEGDVDGYRADCHLQPPLRTAADRTALCRGLKEGVIDAVCSDHQPHDADAKSAPFPMTEPGASTIELLLPLVLGLVHDDALALPAAIAALCSKPAAIVGGGIGSLAPGMPADVAVIDPDQRFRVDAATLRSSGRNTPFHGRELRGRVTHTLFDGRIVFEGGRSG
jgi:dihydroorotase